MLPKGRLRISSNPRQLGVDFPKRLPVMGILTVGAVMIAPIEVSKALDHQEHRRMQRVPDTWATTATEDGVNSAMVTRPHLAPQFQLIWLPVSSFLIVG